jgi:hypothetical protein
MKKFNDAIERQGCHTRPDLLYYFSVAILLLAFGYILFGVVCIAISDYHSSNVSVDFEDSVGGN